MLWIVRQSDQGNWLFYLHLMYLHGTASARMSPAFACVPYNIYQIQTRHSSIIFLERETLSSTSSKYEKQYEKVIFKNMQHERQLFKAVVYLVYAGVLSWKFCSSTSVIQLMLKLESKFLSWCKTIKLILQTLFLFWGNEKLSSFFLCIQCSAASSLFEFFITTSFC